MQQSLVVSILLGCGLVLAPMIVWVCIRKFYTGAILYVGVVVLFMVFASQIGQLNLITIVGVIISFVVLFFGAPKNKPRGVMSVPLVGVNKTYYVEDMNKGTLILGASGSGKTQSVVRAYLEHCAKNDFAGMIYDFKDFELTEVAAGFFRDHGVKMSVFAIHNVNASVRINPIAAEYIETENAVRSIVRNMFLNLKGQSSGDTFFNDAAEGLLVAMIWRMKTHFPELCNLPFISAILLQVDVLHSQKKSYGNLFDFITADRQAAIKAATFVSGLESEKQTAAVYATLTNLLLCFDNPNIFYLMSGDDISLDVTHDDHRRFLSIVCDPKDAVVLSPINAMIIDLMTLLVRRGRKQSAWIIDEAHTVKINEIETKISYLRSYGGCFVWCMQSKIQGMVRMDDSQFKKIAENLSTQFYGKVNDPETGEFYEKHFEFIKEKQLSFSRGSVLTKGESRVNKSFRERKKIRAHEFQKLQAGEFVLLSSGRDTKFRFKNITILPYTPPQERSVTVDTLIRYQQTILDLAAQFIVGGWNNPISIIQQFKAIQF